MDNKHALKARRGGKARTHPLGLSGHGRCHEEGRDGSQHQHAQSLEGSHCIVDVCEVEQEVAEGVGADCRSERRRFVASDRGACGFEAAANAFGNQNQRFGGQAQKNL
jgi:hypothetical protein